MEDNKAPKGCNIFAFVFVIINLAIYAYGVYKLAGKLYHWIWS